MTPFDLACAYLWHRKVLTGLTAAGIAFGATLVFLVVDLGIELRRGLLQSSHGVDLIVGAAGSETAVVFASLFHVDSPRGNLPLRTFEQIAGTPGVRACCPLCLGDDFHGSRIVGTTSTFFREFGPGPARNFSLATGAWFESDLQIVAGSEAARTQRLTVGQTILTTHGGGKEHDEHPYKVVGILQPTGTPHDRALFCSMSSYWEVHEEKSSPAGFEREVTTLLLRCDGPQSFSLLRTLPQKFGVMAVRPVDVLNRMFELVLAPVERILVLHGYAVVLTALTMLALALILALELHVRDMGILRCLGAGPAELFAFVLWQAMVLLMTGIALGIVIARLALWALQTDLVRRFGIHVDPVRLSPTDALVIAAILVSGLIVAAIPAWQASCKQVASILDS